MRGRFLHKWSFGARFCFWWALALITSGDLYLWQLNSRSADARNAAQLFLENLNKWVPTCRDFPGRRTACNVTFSFSYPSADGAEQYATLDLSKNQASLFVPIERSSIISWRVDDHPFVEVLSLARDGAVLPPRPSARLITEMLTGKRLEVQFVEPVTNRRIDESFSLDGFPAAYARYQQMQKHPATTYN